MVGCRVLKDGEKEGRERRMGVNGMERSEEWYLGGAVVSDRL